MKRKKFLSTMFILAVVLTMAIGFKSTVAYAADTSVSTWSGLKAAVTAAPTNGTLYTIDISGSFNTDNTVGTINIDSGKNIVIESVGGLYTITRDSAFKRSLLCVCNSANLTLKSITLDGNAENVTSNFEMVYIFNGGMFTMNTGATIQNEKGDVSGNSAGVCVESLGTMTMKTGAAISNVENINVGDRGALFVEGTLNMEGGSITGCKGVNGGIASTPGSTINLSGGSVTGNTCFYGGINVAGTIKISESPNISVNKKADGTTPCNVFLWPGSVITVAEPFNPTTAIGITTASTPSASSPVNITEASNQDWSSKFSSDNASYMIQNSGTGSSQVVQLAAIPIPTPFSATVTVNKDGAAYSSGTPDIELSTSDMTLQNAVTGTSSGGVYTFSAPDDTKTYYVWDTTSNKYTGQSVTNSSSNAVINYYTVNFAVINQGAASGSTISAVYDSFPINSGDVVLGGKQLVITAVGQGASSYTYAWSGTGTSGELVDTVTIANLGTAVNATCIVNSRAPKIITLSLPDGTVNTTYNNMLSAITISPITWSVTSGALPTGLSLNTSTGDISGTPTVVGTSSFTITATSTFGTDVKPFSILINSVALLPQAAPTGLLGTAPTTYGGADGMITGVTTDMEYKRLTDVSYTVVTGTAITGLPAGTYYVRYSAKTGYSAGADAAVVVPEGQVHNNNSDRDRDRNSANVQTSASVPITIAARVISEVTSSQPSIPSQNNAVSPVIKPIAAAVTVENDGTKTALLKASEAIAIIGSDGTQSALTDMSKVSFTLPDSTNTTSTAASAQSASAAVAQDGTLCVKGLANNTESTFAVVYDLGNGKHITIGYIDVKVSGNGSVDLTSTLIDPYGIVTDSSTGNVLSGVNVQLFYANTSRNTANGKTPDTQVSLSEVNGFKPSNNANPQVSDMLGQYGFMVYPTSDYYVVATKDGYNKYISPIISVEQTIVKWDFAMNRINLAKPTIVLKGASDIKIAVNSTYSDLGASAADNAGNNITSSIKVTGSVNTSAAGDYKLTYDAADSNGTRADSVTRTVHVIAKQAQANTTKPAAKKVIKSVVIGVYSDSISGSVLAAKTEGILMSAKDYKKIAAIKSIATVYILGGSNVIDKATEKTIKGYGVNNIIRLGGTNAYETSALIARSLHAETGKPVILISSKADKNLVKAMIGANKGNYMIVLTKDNQLDEHAKGTIQNIKPSKVYVAAGITKSQINAVKDLVKTAKIITIDSKSKALNSIK